MNKVQKALWTRRLNYRVKRLHIAKAKNNKVRIDKWTRLVREAKVKLGLVQRKPKIKKPATKKPDVVHNHPTTPSQHKKGIDVSSYNESINWKEVHAGGIEFCFCKTSEGGDWKDPTWTKARVDAMRAAGVKVGVYHFLRPRAGREGRDEMSFFIKQARNAGWGKPGDLRPVIDFEETTLSPDKTLGYLMSAVKELKTLTGKTPIIYTGGPFWEENTNGYKNNLGCPLWLAAYVNNPDKYLPQAWSSQGWAIWQNTDRGPVAGVPSDNVDQNIAKQLPSL